MQKLIINLTLDFISRMYRQILFDWIFICCRFKNTLDWDAAKVKNGFSNQTYQNRNTGGKLWHLNSGFSNSLSIQSEPHITHLIFLQIINTVTRIKLAT